MRLLLNITGLLALYSALNGQVPVGVWSDHLPYNKAGNIAAGREEIYASTGSSIIVYNKEFSELKKLSPVNGLSETGISTIAWSAENEILIVAYKSSNIDLVSKNTVYNIPDILNKYIQGEKKINRITTSGKYAYLATSFGIVVIDLIKKEIRDTWRPGPDSGLNEVFDVAFGNGKVYAATQAGAWFGDISNQGLAYFGNWDQITGFPDPDSRCTLVFFAGNKLYVNLSQASSTGDFIYSVDNGTTLFSFIPGVFNKSFDKAPNGFIISSGSLLRFLNSDGSLKYSLSSYGWGTPDIRQAAAENGTVWMADMNYGLIKGENNNVFTSLSLSGPASEEVSNISYADGKIIICSGGMDHDWSGLGRDYAVSAFENDQFTNLVTGTYKDAVRSCIDPENSDHFFISTWGDGLFEYTGNTLIKHYDATNTPELTLNSGNSGIRIWGLAHDKNKNLWLTQTGNAGSIKLLRPDGSWIVNPLTINAPVLGDIISAENGQKWIVLPAGNGLYVIDDNDTPEVFTDDRHKNLIIIDTDEKVISNALSIAEDLDGNIWVGTDQGPVIYYNNERIFENNARANRIKVPRNDGSGLADYMLGTESITSISVDGANRKWLGTKNSGVYLLSPDGATMLKNYKTSNSPIYSDSIASVAVDNKSGEVWFGTAEGVLSVREVATSGAQKFTDVYSFPNPVREDFTGNVTIKGLMRDTNVKITDISGNLVYETISEGGQAAWDLTTFTGHRVATGVYLVFCSGGEGSAAFITKILVIGR